MWQSVSRLLILGTSCSFMPRVLILWFSPQWVSDSSEPKDPQRLPDKRDQKGHNVHKVIPKLTAPLDKVQVLRSLSSIPYSIPYCILWLPGIEVFKRLHSSWCSWHKWRKCAHPQNPLFKARGLFLMGEDNKRLSRKEGKLKVTKYTSPSLCSCKQGALTEFQVVCGPGDILVQQLQGKD